MIVISPVVFTRSIETTRDPFLESSGNKTALSSWGWKLLTFTECDWLKTWLFSYCCTFRTRFYLRKTSCSHFFAGILVIPGWYPGVRYTKTICPLRSQANIHYCTSLFCSGLLRKIIGNNEGHLLIQLTFQGSQTLRLLYVLSASYLVPRVYSAFKMERGWESRHWALVPSTLFGGSIWRRACDLSSLSLVYKGK